MTTHAKMVAALTAEMGIAHRGERLLPSLYTQVMPLILNSVTDMSAAESIARQVVENHLSNPAVRLDTTIMERKLLNGKVLRTEEITVINTDRVLLGDKVAQHDPADGVYTALQCNAMNFWSKQALSLNSTMLDLFKVTVFSLFHSVKGKLPENGGGYKYAYVLEDLVAYLKSSKAEDTIHMSFKAQKGRFYATKRVNYMLAGPIRFMFQWAKPIDMTDRKARRAARHYLLNEGGVTKTNYAEILADVNNIIQTGLNERDPVTGKMVKGRPATTALCEAFLTKWGCSYKKFSLVVACALEMKMIMEENKSQMIYWLDATSDGPMRISALVGCRRLAHYCNIQGSSTKQSLWLKLAESGWARCADQVLAPFFCEKDKDGNWKPSKSVAKIPGTPMVYGAGRGSIAEAMILSDNNSTLMEWGIVDENGVQVPGRVEELVSKSPEIFNDDTIDFFAEAGLENMVDNAKTVAKLYYNSLRRISPKMLAFIKTMRDAFNKSADRGQPLVWTLPNGDTVKVTTWTLDDGPSEIKTFTLPDGKSIRARCKKMVKSTRASGAPPLIVQAEDGNQLAEEAILSEKDNEEMLPLHDARGVRPTSLITTKKRFKKIFYRAYLKGDNRLVNFLNDQGIPLTEIWRSGQPEELDLAAFKASKHFLA